MALSFDEPFFMISGWPDVPFIGSSDERQDSEPAAASLMRPKADASVELKKESLFELDMLRC